MNKRAFFIFIIVYSVLFGLIHSLAYSIAVRSIDNALARQILASVFIIGWLSMPFGLWGSHQHPQKWLFLTWIGYSWLGFFTITMFFAIVEFFVSLYYVNTYSYWILIVSFLVSIYSTWNCLRPPTLVTYKIKGTENLHGFKLVQISDIHLGMLNLNEKWLRQILYRINEIKPNVLAITGDLTEAHFLTVRPMLAAFSKIEESIQIFYITGNHEYIQPGNWEAEIEKYGAISLHNSHRILNYNDGKILIAGVPDISARNFGMKIDSNPDAAIRTPEQVDYRLLLAHQPTSAYQIKNEKCDLMLCGHTHGGQIFPFHLLVRFMMPVVKGFKKINQVLVFTHQGTGYWGPPMRWFSRSEIVIFEWV